MPFQPSVQEPVRKRTLYGVAIAAALLLACAAPWLAWREADRQAYDIESAIVLDYARDIQHRADETAIQADSALQRLGTTGTPPCSPFSLAVMRELDLSFSYIQAVGHLRGTTIDCSSIGPDPVALGGASFLTSKGVTIYKSVRFGNGRPARVLGIRRGDFIVFVHDDLPLDTWTRTPDIALGVLHIEDHDFHMTRGQVDGA